MKRFSNFLILCILLSCTLGYSQNRLASEKIYANSEPAVVYIGNEEGFGTGVIISPDGKILTNFHVVTSALPITVKAKIKTADGYQEKEFKNVEVLKIHQEYDLAILQIKDKSKFKFMSWKQEIKIPTGSTCYAIGNPQSGGESLRNTMTSGLISSANRQYEGKRFLQVSAAVNPGNSGGPLINDRGELIGIITYKALDVEGIGYAIPCSEVAMKDFVIPKEKKDNMEKGIEYEKQGKKMLDKARYANTPETRELLYMLSSYFYKMSMFEMPNKPSPYNNVALLYYNLKKYDFAKAYYKKCLEIKVNPEALHTLGVIYGKEMNEKKAYELWIKGAFLKGGSAPCAENAAIINLKKGRYVEAAYLSKKALIQDRFRNYQKTKVYNDASSHVSNATMAKIRKKTKTDDFSLTEMKQLANNDTLLKKAESVQKEKNKETDNESLSLFNDLVNMEATNSKKKEAANKKDAAKEVKKKEPKEKNEDEKSIDLFNDLTK